MFTKNKTCGMSLTHILLGKYYVCISSLKFLGGKVRSRSSKDKLKWTSSLRTGLKDSACLSNGTQNRTCTGFAVRDQQNTIVQCTIHWYKKTRQLSKFLGHVTNFNIFFFFFLQFQSNQSVTFATLNTNNPVELAMRKKKKRQKEASMR